MLRGCAESESRAKYAKRTPLLAIPTKSPLNCLQLKGKVLFNFNFVALDSFQRRKSSNFVARASFLGEAVTRRYFLHISPGSGDGDAVVAVFPGGFVVYGVAVQLKR